jgi:hypothetical protein
MARLHPCHADPLLSRRLSTAKRSTRGVAPRSNTAQAAKAAMNLFQKNKRNVKRRQRVRLRGDVQRDCRAS